MSGVRARGLLGAGLVGAGLAACGGVPGAARAALAGAHVLFLDFEGGSVAQAAADDAVAGRSEVGGGDVPPFDGAIVAPDVAREAAIAVVADRVRTLYAPFDLDVTRVRPSSGDYAAVVVGGTPQALAPPAPTGTAGIAALDCVDANPRSLGFAFAGSLSPQFGGPVALAAAIAHEAAHGLGLEHVEAPRDPMYSVAAPAQTLDDLFSLRFGAGAYSPFSAGGGTQPERCGRADPLDGAAILRGALGARAAGSAPPTVRIDFPPPVAAVPAALSLEVSAGDDVAVRRVEVYRDLTLVAALDAPPYAVELVLPAAAQTRLTVEAIDDDAQRASAHLDVRVDPAAPAPCDGAHACLGGAACVDGSCAPPSGDGGVATDAGDALAPDGGCALAPRARPSGLWLVVVAAAMRRRRIRGSSSAGR